MKADKPFVSAIIVGAGNGTRMGGKNKALIKIGDKSAFRMVLEAFCAAETVDELVVVCRDKEEMLPDAADCTKPIRYTLGGKTRGESVMNGVKAAKNSAAFYCIHDCARPLVTAQIIDSVVSAALEKGAATACGPVNDTVKYVDRENGTVYTPDRSKLIAVQTPQVFEARLYKISAALGEKDGITATDDTTLAEHAGFKVEYVESPTPNFKLTRSEDVYLARLLVKLSEKEGHI
ncbi:MAG: 2-C-methyl-D-erythritol 4-phosphate cytidylyltransferase [Ruminococcaceae bacterium]|nr:2-C-methyl-D-erythritol 4-phosphate cytidylyltransferase [Oscillospiraceae bacterium]